MFVLFLVCGDTVDLSVVTSGTFSVPYPYVGNYSEPENCTITFTVPTGFLGQFSYDEIDIAFADNLADCTTNGDYIEVRSIT